MHECSLGSRARTFCGVVLCLGLGCGCNTPWQVGRLPAHLPEQGEQGLRGELASPNTQHEKLPAEASPHTGDQPTVARRGTAAAVKAPEQVRLTAAEIASLADDGWLKLEPSPDQPNQPRWRHAGVEALALLSFELGELRPHLKAGGAAAANAAIVLARRGDDSGLAVLEQAIRDRALKPNLRCAAAEALGRLQSPAARSVLRQLGGEQGGWQREGGYLADLHAELLRGIRARLEPADRPLVEAALASQASVVLVEALRAVAAGGWDDLAQSAAALRLHPDAAVRAEALRSLALLQHPQAAGFCVTGMSDQALAVRLAAAEALASCPGREAENALLEALARQEEQVRAAAVRALGMRGAFAAVRRAADDQSWRVRRAAAAALAKDATAEGAAVLRRLLGDRSPDVQLAAVMSLGELPPTLAGEILLEALAHPVYRTRAAARDQLARFWPDAARFAPEAPLSHRRALIAELREHGLSAREGGTPSPGDAAALTTGHPGALGQDEEHLSHGPTTDAVATQQAELSAVRQALAALREGQTHAAVPALEAFGAGLPELLAAVAQAGEPLPEAIWHDVLPRLAQEYVWLDVVAGGPDAARRQAAAKLAQQAGEGELPWLVLERLAMLGTREADATVLRSLLQAVSTDGRPAALALARASLGHPAPEIRRMACEQLRRFPAREHVPPLMAALEDPHATVAAAAAQALGEQPQPIDTAPLEKLLAAPDRYLRLAAAVSLVRLHSDEGIAALERLAHDPDVDVRRLAATAMGELGLPEFVPTLISLLNDESRVRHAALAALPRAAGHDLPETQPGDPEHGLDAALRWQRLWRR